MTLRQAGCNVDCFHCPYPDCVVNRIPKKWEENRGEYYHDYYVAHWEVKRRQSDDYHAAHRDELLAYWRRRNKKRYDRLKAAGICVRCMKRPAMPGMIRCEACREAEKERQREVRRKKNGTALAAKG